MKFEFERPSGFWGNYVLMCWWDSNMSDLGWKVKGQPRPLKLIYSHFQVPRSSAFWFWRRRLLNVFYHIWAWRPSLSCDQNILHQFWLTYHEKSSHEIWIQSGQIGLWENYVLIYWWDSNMSDLSWKVKGQPWPFELIYSHCLIWLNISSENNDYSFHSFQKNQLFRNVPI